MTRMLFAAVSVAALLAIPIADVHAQAKPKALSANGTVKSVSANSLAVTAGAKEMTFTIDNTTKVVGKGLTTKSGGAPMSVTDAVAAGDHVRVSYHDMSGTMHATTITVTTKAAGKGK
jgi:hypothetical protein